MKKKNPTRYVPYVDVDYMENKSIVQNIIEPFLFQYKTFEIPVAGIAHNLCTPSNAPSTFRISIDKIVIYLLNGRMNYCRESNEFGFFNTEGAALVALREYCTRYNFICQEKELMFSEGSWQNILAFLRTKDKIGAIEITEEMHNRLEILSAYYYL